MPQIDPFAGLQAQPAVTGQAMVDPFAGLNGSLGIDTSGVWENNNPSTYDRIVKATNKGVADYAMGGLRGAARIGTTVLAPIQKAIAAQAEQENPGLQVPPANTKPALEQFFAEHSDPNSLPFKAGDLSAQIAGTAGTGSLLAKGLIGAGTMVPGLANFASKAAPILESGGFNLGNAALPVRGAGLLGNTLGYAGNLAMRGAGGAAVGGAATALVEPEAAGTGAAIGALMPMGAKVAGDVAGVVPWAAKHILGGTTGVGSEGLGRAYAAGRAGGTTGETFLNNIGQDVPATDVIDLAKKGVANLQKIRGDQYRSGMVDISADKTALDIAPIQKAIDGLASSGTYQPPGATAGFVKNQNAASTVNDLVSKFNEFKASIPEGIRTPEALDAFKQAVGDIRDTTQQGTGARKAVDTVYNAVKSQISEQAPTYAKVMADYHNASEQLDEITRTFSLTDRASQDTAMRKLQSIMRNNVNTNWGNRLSLADTLQQQGGVDIATPLAGQALSSWMPRGMTGAIEKSGPIAAGAALLSGHPAVAGGMLAAAPFMSPKTVGMALYGLGAASRGLGGASGAVPAITPAAAVIGRLLGRSVPQYMGPVNSALSASLATP